jgi:hypothetical protein
MEAYDMGFHDGDQYVIQDEMGVLPKHYVRDSREHASKEMARRIALLFSSKG